MATQQILILLLGVRVLSPEHDAAADLRVGHCAFRDWARV